MKLSLCTVDAYHRLADYLPFIECKVLLGNTNWLC